MKKLLSAVTSIVMSLTLMTSAFASSVSAAGGNTAVQPNVSIGGVSDVSANKNAANSNLLIDFGGTYTGEKGKALTISPTISSADGAQHPIAGIHVNFQLDSPLTLSAVAAKSDAFGGSKVSANKDELIAEITPIDPDSGDPTNFTDGGSLFKINVMIPENCPDGEYTFSIKNDSDFVYVTSTNQKWTYSVKPATIKVGNGSSVSTTTTSSVTTTATTAPSGNANIVVDFGGTVVGEKGKTVTIEPTIASADGKQHPIAGIHANFLLDSPLTLAAIAAKSDAFGGSKVSANKEELIAEVTPIDPDSGDPTNFTDGGKLFKINVAIPADCPDGEYTFSLKNDSDFVYITTTNEKWTYTVKPATIKVGNGSSVTTTSSSVTTSTTTKQPSGKSNLVIDFGSSVTAKPGSVVTIEPTISSGDGSKHPIAGVHANFTLDAPLELAAIAAKSDAFGGSKVTANKDKLVAEITPIDPDTGDPSDFTEGGKLFKINISIPENCADGDYVFSMKNDSEFVYITATNELWTYSVNPVTIKVSGSGDTTTSSSSTTTTTTTTTTSSTTSSSTTSATTTVTAVPGSVQWIIPTVNALPGETVTMNVVVKNSDLEVAGAQFSINAKAPIAYSSSTGAPAYDSNLVANGATKQFAFGQGIGKGVKAAEGSAVLTLTYTVPADCAAGRYPVEWSKAFISDTNGNDITSKVILTDGAIVVGTVGDVSWVLDKVTAKPGDTVTVNAVVSDPKGTALSVAGAQFNIDVKAPIVYKSIKGSDAYDANIVNNDSIKAFAFAQGVGSGVAAADGAKVLVLTFTVPNDCPAGDYPITWSNAFISDTNGNSITDSVSLINGLITIEGNETKGDVTWNIPEVEAQPGDEVTLNVVVEGSSDPVLAVAGAQFSINADSPIVYGSIAGSDAYNANVVANNTTKQFAFAQGVGSGVAAADGQIVLVLKYTVPEDCADGTYAVKWSNAFISDTYGNDITSKVTLDDGAIIVKKATTTTSSSTTSATTTEGTETTTSATTTVSGETTTESTTVSTDTTTSATTTETTSSTTSSTTTLPPRAVLWKIDTVEAQPGDTVTINMVVVDSNNTKLPVAGAQFSINADSPIIYGGVGGTSEAYGANVVANGETKQFAFADGIGAGVASVDGKNVITLTYTVPQDCADGTYPVKISDLFVSSTDGADMTGFVLTENGAIIVKKITTTSATTTSETTTSATTTVSGETTTTESTTVSTDTTTSETTTSATTTVSGETTTTESTTVSTDTTTSATTTETTSSTTSSTTTLPPGAVLWKIDTVEAQPGDTVTINMVVGDSNNTKLPIAGAQFSINAESPIIYAGVGGTSEAYGADVVANGETKQFAFADGIGAGVASVDGKNVITLTYTVPKDCADGTYAVKLSDLFVSSTDGADMTDRVLIENGAIIVKKITTTSETTTSATTTVSGDTTTTESTTVSGETTTTESTTVSGETTTTESTTVSGDTTTSATTTVSGDTTTSSTTTLPDIPDGGIAWQVGSKTVDLSDKDVEIKLNVIVIDSKASELAISGAQFTMGYNDKFIELVGATGSSAYTAPITFNTETSQLAFANGKGVAVAADNMATVVELTFKVSKDTPVGTYPVDLNNLFVTNADGEDITNLVIPFNGAIKVTRSGVNPSTDAVFAKVLEKTHGFYFSHDNGTRNNGQKGGFSPAQIKKLEMYNVTNENGVITTSKWADSEIDMSMINYGDAVPMTVYDASNTTFKYEVPVYYGEKQLLDVDTNEPVTVTVYIGVKGDIDLDNKVLAYDASLALTFYSASQAAKPADVQLSTYKGITDAHDVLDDFCAFLGDVDANEWAEDNWCLTKAQRRILANDASGILTFYATVQKEDNPDFQKIWDEIVPERFS